MNGLTNKRDELIALWFDRVIESYPPQAAQFLKKQGDAFANPVGTTFRRNLEVLYDHLLGEVDSATLESALDSICRIRSVQDFKPSEAVGFLFQLKDLLRAQSATDEPCDLTVDVKIDRLALQAFDTYQRCREELAQVRVNEARRQTDALVRQLNCREHAK